MPRTFPVSLLVLALLVLAPVPALCAEKLWIDVRGTITFADEKGRVTKLPFVRYRDVLYTGGIGGDKDKKIGYFKCDVDQVPRQIAVKDIRSVMLNASSRDSRVEKYSMPPAGLRWDAILTNRAGQTMHVYLERNIGYSLNGMEHVEFDFLNRATNAFERGHIAGYLIEAIEFDEEAQILDPTQQNLATEPSGVDVDHLYNDTPRKKE